MKLSLPVLICRRARCTESVRRPPSIQAYRPLDEGKAASSIIISTPKGDKFPEIVLTLRLIREMYCREGSRSGLNEVG